MMPATCVNLVVIAKLKRATMRMWYEIRFRGSIGLRASWSSWHLSLGWTEWRKLWFSISCAIGRIKTNYRPRRNLLKLMLTLLETRARLVWNQFVSWTWRRDARRVDSLASERNFHLLKQETYVSLMDSGVRSECQNVRSSHVKTGTIVPLNTWLVGCRNKHFVQPPNDWHIRMTTNRLEPSQIKNKIKREEITQKKKKAKSQEKLKRRLALAKAEAKDPAAKKVRGISDSRTIATY